MLIYEDFTNVINCINPCLGEYYIDISLDLWFENLERYWAGQRLKRQIDRKLGY